MAEGNVENAYVSIMPVFNLSGLLLQFYIRSDCATVLHCTLPDMKTS